MFSFLNNLLTQSVVDVPSLADSTILDPLLALSQNFVVVPSVADSFQNTIASSSAVAFLGVRGDLQKLQGKWRMVGLQLKEK